MNQLRRLFFHVYGSPLGNLPSEMPSAPNFPTISRPFAWIVTNSPNAFAHSMAWSILSNSNTSSLCLMNIKSVNPHENNHINNQTLLFLERVANKLFFVMSIATTLFCVRTFTQSFINNDLIQRAQLIKTLD